uniref:Ankyrin repeat domain-containing protein 49 n=1 Tax=Schistocephalus solidus TaxID=70667 RepID=A0A0X3PCM2_SCHSO
MMSSESEDEDLPPDLRHNPEEIMRAKERNPGMFVSAWQADEEDIDQWTKKQLRRDRRKQLVVAAERGDMDALRSNLANLTPAEKEEFLLFTDDDGYTALHRAVYGGHYDVVEYLLSEGARVDTRSVDGWTPLHSAAFWNQTACVQLLIEAGADMNALTNSNQSLLHLAVSNNTTVETLCYLLGHPNINVDVKNSGGDTPADLLKRNTSLSYLLYPLTAEATRLLPSK